MCGIVGMAGDIEFADRKIFRDMLDVCQVRGRDSTGVININRAKNYGYVKNVGPPAYLFDRRSYSEVVESGMHSAFIGHCRHKTVGLVSVQNAHPFDFEDEGIIGVHNGTLTRYNHLDGHSHQKVDSEVLYGHLAKHGPENTFDKIDGAWACVWWDNNAETVNFIRNKQRPLWFTWSACKRKLFWASEPWMFGSVERHVDLWKGPKDDYEDRFFPLPEDTLWSIEIAPSAPKGQPTIKFKQPKKIEAKPHTPARNHMGNAQGVVSKPPGGNQGAANGSSSSLEDFFKEAQRVWNLNSSKTHKWDWKLGKFVPIMEYEEWIETFRKAQGGSVPNPFQLKDDQLPPYMLPKPETLEFIKDGKKVTRNSTGKSTTNSPKSSDSSKGSQNTESGSSNTTSQGQRSSTLTEQQNKRNSSERPKLQLVRNTRSNSTPAKVSFRTVAGLPFITDEKTGAEYSEQQVEENTQGFCSFCDAPIGDLTEISEFFSHDRFICTHCTTEPKVQVVA